MDPVTHILTSAALGRAGADRLSALAMPMLITSGLVADADWATRLTGPEAFLRGHRTATHSLLGVAISTVVVALVFVLVGRFWSARKPGIFPALLVCAIGTTTHLLLDLFNPDGVTLLWPFKRNRYALDSVDSIDAWMIFLLLAGLLLPELFRMVRSEIGSKSATSRGRRGAIFGLVLVALLIAGRFVGHRRAEALLNSREYDSVSAAPQTPLRVGALPTALNPFAWRGLVLTDNAVATLDVSLLPGAIFNPDAAVIHYKPEDSPALRNAEATRTVKLFLEFARFPVASVEPEGDGFRVRMRDLRFEGQPNFATQVVAIVDLDAQGRVVSERLEFLKPLMGESAKRIHE